MLYREGDTVTLKARVVFDQESEADQLHLDVEGDTSKLIVDAKAVMLLQAAFKVGDRLMFGQFTGEVVAVAGAGLDALLWVRDGFGKMHTLDAIACKRAPLPAMPAGGIGSWVKDEKAEFLAGGE